MPPISGHYGGDHAEIHINLAKCFQSRSQYDKALAHFSDAVALEPGRAEFHYLLGRSRYEFRHMAEAIAAFQRVLEIDPAHHAAASSLLYACQMICDWDQTQRLQPLVRAATDQAIAAGTPCGEGALENLSRDADPRRNLMVASAFARGHLAASRIDLKCRPATKVHGAPL